MELAPVELKRKHATSIAARLRKEFRFATFYMLPLLADFRDDIGWMADLCRISYEQAELNRYDLLEAGVWVKTGDGKIRTSRTWLGIGDEKEGEATSSGEFLTMISQILSRISDDGPCWYEWQTFATTNELKMEFLSRVNQALTDLIQKSKEAQANTVLAWAHVSLDSLKALREEDDSWRV